MTFDGDRRQLSNDIMQWAVFLLAIAAVFLRNHSQTLDVILGLLSISALAWIILGFRWIRVPRVVHDVRKLSPEDNRKVWGDVRDSYCYFGISGGTMQVFLQGWVNRNHFPKAARIRILLAMPFSMSIRESKELEKGCPVSDEEFLRASQHVEAMAQFYSGLQGVPHFEVRFYEEYHGYWCHLLNGEEAIVGHYLNGKDGLESLALHLKQTAKGNELFQFYKEEFERIWKKAIPVEEYFERKASEVAR